MQMLKLLWGTSKPLTFTGLLMLPALALAIFGLIFDPRTVVGAPVWLKPAKFAASIAIYTFTLAWIFSLIPDAKKTRSVIGWLTAVVMVIEITIIDLQAYRGTTSHFNFSTPLDGALFTIMGASIVTQTFASVAVAVALWREKFQDRAMGWALRTGMVITITGALTAGLMTRPTSAQLADAHAGKQMRIVGAHTVGAPDGGPGLPGTGWSTKHGDLRIPHFMGLHALQVLPLAAVLLRRRELSMEARVRLIVTLAASYFALLAMLVTQALRGQSIIAPDGLTLALLGGWALFTAISAWMAINRTESIATMEVA